MAKWFEKYGFGIKAVYEAKAEGGAIAGGCADVQICKEAKNVWVKGWETKEEAMIAYADERRAMMY